MFVAAAVLAFAVSMAVTRLLLSRFGRLALDQPNERSLHQQPVPRTGGLAVFAGLAVSLALGAASLWWLLALALALLAISFLDDLYGVPTMARLLAHLAAAAFFVWYTLSPAHVGLFLSLALAVAWLTNLYNFMDGSDGLAGGMSVVGFGSFFLAALQAGEGEIAVVSLALASSSLAFLVHNLHPARIFLGDVGSIPAGFLAGALGVLGWRNDAWPLWFPLLVFGPFVGDATITLLKRLALRKRVWDAHRDHYYQRLVRMGLGHRRTAYIAYCAMAICAGLALWAREQAPAVQAGAFGAGVALLALVAISTDLMWVRFSRRQGGNA